MDREGMSMGTLLLIALGIGIGWLLFRPKQDKGKREKQAAIAAKKDSRQAMAAMRKVPTRQSSTVLRDEKDHTLRNVAGGVVAGAVLGHLLSGDKETVNQETTNNYVIHQDPFDNEECDAYDDLIWDDDEGDFDEDNAAAYDSDYEEDSDYNDSDNGDEESGWNDFYDDDDD